MKKKLALIQMESAMEEPEKNFSHALALMEEALSGRPDILVLPELWNTGFFPSARLQNYADPEGKRTISTIGNFAGKHAVNVVAGSVTVTEQGRMYNRSFVFNREGKVISSYDKIHGFSLGGEPEYFKMGDHFSHFELDGIPCSMALCYDVRFPELIRNEALEGVDLFFLPAAWPEVREKAWRVLTRARAVENEFYLCAVNQGGVSGHVKYAGQSALFDPWGEEVCRLGREEGIGYGEMDTEKVRAIRKQIDVYHDRRLPYDLVRK